MRARGGFYFPRRAEGGGRDVYDEGAVQGLADAGMESVKRHRGHTKGNFLLITSLPKLEVTCFIFRSPPSAASAPSLPPG